MRGVSDGTSGSQRGSDHAGFGQFGVGGAGSTRVPVVNVDAIRALRRERDGHGNEFFVFDRNGARGNGRFVESPESFHYFRCEFVHFFQPGQIFFVVHISKLRFVVFCFVPNSGFAIQMRLAEDFLPQEPENVYAPPTDVERFAASDACTRSRFLS